MDITELKPITSSNLAAVGYHAPTKTLAVQFKGGDAVHHYHGVEQEHVDELHAADSIGSHFSKYIRNGGFLHVPPATKEGK